MFGPFTMHIKKQSSDCHALLRPTPGCILGNNHSSQVSLGPTSMANPNALLLPWRSRRRGSRGGRRSSSLSTMSHRPKRKKEGNKMRGDQWDM